MLWVGSKHDDGGWSMGQDQSEKNMPRVSARSGIDRDLLALRLRKAREAAGLSRKAAAVRAGISENSIYRYEVARNAPRSEILSGLARIYGRPVEWFYGEPTAETHPDWKVPDDSSGVLVAEIASVPVIATMAGSGSFCYEESVRYWMPWRQDLLVSNGIAPGGCQAVELKGDSMAPSLPDGSLVLVDTSRFSFWDGRLYLLLVPNEGVVLRQMVRDGQDWVVTADNPVWRPRVYQAAWQVLGEALVGVHFLA